MSEWLNLTDKELDYHLRQINKPYRSTEMFADFIQSEVTAGMRIVDLGCGGGGVLKYIKSRFPKCRYTGVDLNDQVLAVARTHVTGVKFICESMYDHEGEYDGVISLQMLSWLDDYQELLMKMISFEPKFIALTSLFYDGAVHAMIKIVNQEDKLKPKISNYNIYSLQSVDRLFKGNGYTMYAKPFEIDIDIPKGEGMGTYTEKLEGGGRIQISGPLLMPWYFILATREGD